jgi:threonine dehydrogenase-like Zn-dependent dehydrogenase
MRQLTMTEDRSIEWLEVPEPKLEGDGEALVRPLAVALCDLDQPILRGEAPIPGPIAIGHEFIAEVVEPGDALLTFTAGDRVSVPFQISCGDCDSCRRGMTGDCDSVPPGSMYGFGAFGGDWGGGISDLVRVPYAEAMLIPAPPEVAPAAIASLSDNIPDGWRTVGPMLDERPGAEVLIVGGGAPSIPLYAADIAIALGSERVVYADTNPDRLRTAEALGAEVVEGPPERKYGRFPITVDASGAHEGLQAALRSTEPGGTCTSIGIYYEETTPMPLLEMYTRGVTFRTGRVMARAAMPEVLTLITEGRLHTDLVTSRVAPWSDAAEAVQERETKLIIER